MMERRRGAGVGRSGLALGERHWELLEWEKESGGCGGEEGGGGLGFEG